ncbi:hypothetical protein HRbin22_00574 [Candidatus Thermoflexus japonica]|uniref:Uncharacterized protein n=2 Tax=root TaxID=1 RepID=A0A2H5Y4H5_9CHLR|nr:hypothetical protein HRbin22_00574 [Candidatus Thermoflexus japonica]
MGTSGPVVELRFAWRSVHGSYVTARFQAVIEGEDPVMRQFFCRLVTLLEVQIPEGLEDPVLTADRLRALEGKQVKVPEEALYGRTLSLKRETLTGGLRIPYFK